MKKTVVVLAVAALLLTFLTACGGDREVVNVYNWGEYIDEEVLEQFEKDTGIKVNYKTFETNEQLYSVLKQGGVSYDVIIPSDYMISRMINEGMLEKINMDNIPNLAYIDKSLIGMEYDPKGEYSVPYMTGTVGLIYNSKLITDEITSWGALFDEKYAGQILMFDNPRDAMGIALKYLGYSLNTTDKDQLMEAYDLLVKQKPLLQAYVMDQIFDKLESGEAAIGPYYAGDYIIMVKNNPDLKLVMPEEGSNRFVDAMCIPKGAENKKNAEVFINYMCSVDASLKNALFIGYTSPNTEIENLIELESYEREVMYPSMEILDKCEFFINLPQDILDLYDELWINLKK
ncbi:MAG: ABC transporter substrate-binding protein [Oscillospiraceae bacterium]